MSFDFDRWLAEAARRAGMRHVPTAAVGAVAALALAAVVFAAWRFWPAGSADLGETQATASVATAGASLPPTAAAQVATQTATAVVQVVGAVRSPGVYELPEGSRVADALEKAGGMLPDAVASAINLARPVADGEQILVPDEDAVEKGAVAAPSASPSAAGPSTSGASAKVDLNSADAAALDTLPGVGPSTAQKIIAEREANGPFATVDDLGRVSGIGPKRLDQLRDLVSVGP